MEASVVLGRVRGIVVGVHWSVLVILVLITVNLGAAGFRDDVGGYATGEYWLAAIVTGVLFLGSILAHELGHSLVAQRHGVVVDRITLWLLGGVSEFESNAKTPRDEFGIAVVGPVTSLAIGIVAVLAALALDLGNGSPLVVELLWWLGGINVVLAVFNLIPAVPLDGGRVLHAGLWSRFKDPIRATIVSARAGRLLGALAIGFGVVSFFAGSGGGLWYALLGWFIVNAAAAEEQYAIAQRRLGSLRVADVMSEHPVAIAPDISLGDFVSNYVMRSPYSSFPVVDASGQVQRLLTLRRVKLLPAARWPTTRAADVACPVSEVPLARADEPVVDALTRMRSDCAEGRLLVVDDAGRLVGILAPSDVKRAMELAQVLPRQEQSIAA